MMRGVRHWAVSVRLPAPETTGAFDGSDAPAADANGLGPVQTSVFELGAPSARARRVRRLPLIRGVVGLWGSMAIGLRALSIAADAQVAADPELAAEMPSGLSGGVWAGTIVVSLALAVGLFFVVPVTLTSLIKHQLGSSWLFWLVEGVVRTVIFIGYLLLLARLPDLRRVLQYHGAEHKTISCYEAGEELTPERAARYSRLHPRCGTSFLLIVMIISIFIFAPIGLPAWWILVLTRIAGVPIVVGLAFEAIKFSGRHRTSPWVAWLIWPGMQLQRLTTAEPSLDQLEVAIAALSAVLERETPGSLTADDLIGVEVSA